MKTIEQLKAEHAKEIEAHAAKLARCESLASLGLPVPDYVADGRTHGAVHIGYWNRTESLRSMSEAVAVFAKFARAGAVIPFHVLKDGLFTTCHPETRMPQKKGHEYRRDSGRNSSAYAALLSVKYTHENRATRAALDFFAIVEGDLLAVSVDFGTGYIGDCRKLAPVVKDVKGDRYNPGSRSFSPNPAAYGMSDGYLLFSSGDNGPMKTAADHRFLFVSDTDEPGPIEVSHALGMLENLAAEVDA